MAKYILGDIFEGDYPISQYYSNNPDYYKQFGFAGHEGVDWATPVGVKVLAPFDYEIIRDVDDLKSGAYGNHIVVWDPVQKCAVWYCHLSVNYKAIGDKGKKGDVIGLSGNSGNTSGPHIHVNFVETDANKNRLNTANGYKGFLNILDSNLVEWNLGGQQATIPVENQQKLINELREARDKNWNLYQEALIEVTRQKELVDKLNQQINDRNNDIVKANAEISTLRTQVLTMNERVNSLETQAILVPQLKKENEHLTDKVARYQEAEKTWNKSRAQLESQIAEFKKNSLKQLIISVFEKAKNIWHKTT